MSSRPHHKFVQQGVRIPRRDLAAPSDQTGRAEFFGIPTGTEFSSGLDSFFPGWEADEVEGSLRSNRFAAPANEPLRLGRRLVLVSGERPNVSQEAVFQLWAITHRRKSGGGGTSCPSSTVAVRRFAIGSDNIGSPGDLGDVDGSFASGDEEVFDVPVVEMVPPVRPSVASMRAGFVGWMIGILRIVFTPWVIDAFGSKIPTKLALEEIQQWNAGVATRTRVEVVHVGPPHDVSTRRTSRRQSWLHGLMRRWAMAGPHCRQQRMCGGGKRGVEDRRRGDQNQEEPRALWALQFVQPGELSGVARHMDPIPELPSSPCASVQFDEQTVSRNVRSDRRGAAGEPSGMTTDPPIVGQHQGHPFVVHSELLVRGRIPGSVDNS